MHELGLVERLLEVALEHAAQAGSGPIRSLELAVGRESGVSPDAIRFYWPQVSDGTRAEGARLRFRRVPGSAVGLRSLELADGEAAGGGRRG